MSKCHLIAGAQDRTRGMKCDRDWFGAVTASDLQGCMTRADVAVICGDLVNLPEMYYASCCLASRIAKER